MCKRTPPDRDPTRVLRRRETVVPSPRGASLRCRSRPRPTPGRVAAHAGRASAVRESAGGPTGSRRARALARPGSGHLSVAVTRSHGCPALNSDLFVGLRSGPPILGSAIERGRPLDPPSAHAPAVEEEFKPRIGKEGPPDVRVQVWPHASHDDEERGHGGTNPRTRPARRSRRRDDASWPIRVRGARW